MGFLGRLFSGREKAAPETTVIAQLLRAGMSPRRGTAELLEAYRTNPWARAVVGRIGSEVACAARWTLFDRPERDPQRKQIFAHPLLDLLDEPNPEAGLSAQVVWSVTQNALDLIGDGFLIKDRNALGKVCGLTPAPATAVTIPSRFEPNFLLALEGGGVRKAPPSDVLWLKDPDPANPNGHGAGTAEAAADEIDIDAEATKQIKSFFRNGMLPSHMVTLEGAGEPEVAAFDTFLRAKYQGSANRNKTHITNKRIQVERLETSFKDMELVPLRKDQRDRFVQVYGVPPELFGILDSSNRATIDAAYYLFAKAVILPRLRLLRAELQMKLVRPEYGKNLFLGFESPIPEDRDFFIRAVATSPSAFYVGEVRSKCGLAPAPAIDGERLNSAPINAGATNLPPAKSLNGSTQTLGMLLDELDARTRSLLVPGATNGPDAQRRLEAAVRLERELS